MAFVNNTNGLKNKYNQIVNKLERIIIKDSFDVPWTKTSHDIGLKRVLLSNVESTSMVTQIAYNKLSKGDKIGCHTHESMDEHFLFIEGKGEFIINNTYHQIKPGLFILVPAKYSHGIVAYSDLNFMTFSVAI